MSTTLMDGIAAQIHEAQARISALDTELFALTTQRRALAFDAATGNDEAKKALANIERSITRGEIEQRYCQDIVAEGEERLRQAETKLQAEERARLADEYARAGAERDALYQEVESLVTGLVTLMPTLTAVDATVRNLGLRLEIPQARFAFEAVNAFVGNRLTCAGLPLQGSFWYPAYEAPLSASKHAEWEATQRLKRAEEEGAGMARHRAVPPLAEALAPLFAGAMEHDATNEEAKDVG